MSYTPTNHHNQSGPSGASHDEIQPFSLSDSDDDQKGKQAVGNGLDSQKDGKEEEEETAIVSRPTSNWSRPQSKPNLVERLENADLDEFERNEREILQQLEDERHSKPSDDDLEIIGLEEEEPHDYNRPINELEVIDEEQEPKSESLKESLKEEHIIEVPDSVQNRQLSSDIRQNSIEGNFSDGSDDYPEGFPVQAVSAPPPAYSSNPTTAQNQVQPTEQLQVVEELQQRNDDTFSLGSELSRKTSEGVGSVVAQAGGIASALAKTVTSTALQQGNQAITKKMSEETNPSSDEDLDINNQSQQDQNTQSSNINACYRLSNDIKELFHYVEEFTADRIDIQPILRPFFLDYFPAVGDVDPFLKIPRPDQIDDQLGLVILDEPAATQSDSTIMDIKLRQMSNVVSKSYWSQSDAPVKKLDRADKNQQHIENWIKNIKELRRSRPPDRVAYSRQMPDLEKLMQEWPPEIDALFQSFALPTAKLDCSLEEYADLCLSLVDIPVHKNRIHALHLLFSLYAEFKNSQHFRNIASNNANSNFIYEAPKTADRLEL